MADRIMTEQAWEDLLRPFGIENICAERGPGTSCRVCNVFTRGWALPYVHAEECPVRGIASQLAIQEAPGTPAIHPRQPM